jgi:hypothetical protein
VPEDKGTCGFVQGVPTGARRAISAQKKNDPETGRSVDPAEVGGLHQVVSEPMIFVPSVDFRQAKREKRDFRQKRKTVTLFTDKGERGRNSGNIKWNQKQRFICIHSR